MTEAHGRVFKNDFVIKRVLISFVFVSILSSLTETIGIMVDNIIVGRFLGSSALAAMTVINPISLVISAFGNVFAVGGTSLMAQAVGRGNYENQNRVFSVTVYAAAIVGILLTVLGLVFTPQLALVLGGNSDTEVTALSIEYMKGYFIGSVPMLLLVTLMGFVKIDGSEKLPLYSMIALTAANIILDLLAVIVFNGSMFEMALATSISHTLATLFCCVHFIKKTNTLKLSRPSLKILTELIKTGAPAMTSRICNTVRNTVLNRMLLSYFGAFAVTAMSVRGQSDSIFGSLIVGMGQAIVPLAGVFFGEEDKTSLSEAMRVTIKVGLILNLLANVFLFCFPQIFSIMLGVADDARILKEANLAIRLGALSMPIEMINYVLINYYQCTKNSGLATFISILESLVFTVLAALCLTGLIGTSGIWISFLINELLTLVCILTAVAVKTKASPFKKDAILLLGDNFGVSDADKLEISIGNSIEEVMTISDGIHKFSRNRDISAKIINRTALCIEEMAGNVVRHAFSDGAKCWFDVVIIDKPDRLIIRMRDNGTAFNPLDFLKRLDTASREEYLGIRIIQGIADSLEYRRTIGLNNLIITLKK